ncbi:MAG: type I asparaginase [Prevotella sp.]
MRTNRVLLIYTGGTIGMGKNRETSILKPLDFNHLIKNVPEFEYIETNIEFYQFNPPIDSSDMHPVMWAKLVKIISERYEQYDGFVILHGTDTMAYTASALSFMLENLTKPVILTGSQLPINQLRTDGKENLLSSIELASAHYADGKAMVPEVCIYFSGRLLRGNRSTKKNTDGFNAFETFNYPHLCDAGINFTFHHHHILTPDFSKPMVPHYEMDSNALILSLFPGLKEDIFKHILDNHSLKSIVMRSFGSGNAPKADWLMKLLEKASKNGTIIVNVSQCVSGNVEMTRYDTGYQLKNIGVISGYDSTIEAAITKLMYLQASYSDNDMIRTKLNQSLAGEISI